METIVRKTTGSVVTPILPAIEDTPTYPSEFFKDNDRPSLTVEYTNVPLDELRGAVISGIQKGELTADLVVAFIYQVCREWEETEETGWTSFGVEIAKRGQNVNPFCMVNVKIGTKPKPDWTVNTVNDNSGDFQLVMGLLGIYRVSNISNETYKEKILGTIQTQLDAIAKNKVMMKTLAVNKQVTLSPNFNMAVACIDMFYHRYKGAEKSVIRVSTLTSRYKDCAALSTLAHISNFTGLSLKETLDWVFSDRVAAEVEQMMRPGEEIDRQESYMPYLKDFRISRRSPYSTTFNSNLHIWGQSACALMGSRRSQNAILMSEDNLVNIMTNAKIMAYVLGTSADLTKAFTVDGEEAGESDDEGEGIEDEEAESEMPKGRQALEWFEYMSSMSFTIPSKMEEKLKAMAKRIALPRPGTIGAAIKQDMGV
ncbi:nucleoprotein [Dolphin rhabdovirus]|uniref:Nucleoprotein n=1 Tax=Dolphin rhabdovirus TaxID=1511639 RepID=A0A068EWX6_9RHAB|nr:nucleoprotein [Dolphin rhabdovirus]AID53188.1 nucleoprotein [Dolphin rhabdovirus]